MKKKRLLVITAIVYAVVLITSCEKLLPPEPAADELLDSPLDGLTTSQFSRFLKGDVAFYD